ncbi:hypothetical protein MMA231_00798 [Asticcacaulis sp. MM231]|uniref:GFA family protein n=1 Tax=Asticcacaulis sp. MM231 TaxID=3157666 RepID=UPI0032D59FA5
MTIKGSCHCGATRFSIDVEPASLTQCTCSICSKGGALWAYYKPEDVRIEPQTSNATYRWQSMMVEHNFCPTCGCITYNRSPSWVDMKPDFTNPQLSVNARLFDDYDISGLPVQVLDGKNLW